MWLGLCALFLSLVAHGEAWYSIKYYIAGGEETRIVPGDLTFAKAPNAVEVADLCVRLSGLQSKSKVSADESLIPRLDAKDRKLPLIYELKGGLLPTSLVTEVVAGSAFGDMARGPHVVDVVDELETFGVSTYIRKFNGEGEKNIKDFIDVLKATPEGQPVIILHQETPGDYHFRVSRRLDSNGSSGSSSSSSSSTNSGPNPAIEAQISDYNIILWTSVVLIAAAYYAVQGINNMEIIPDSLLYAKFTSGRNKKSD